MIIGAAIDVHRELGPGLLEATYLGCLAHELKLRKINIETEKGLPVHYRGIQLEIGYRVDLMVEDLVIVEVKAVERLLPIHEAQLLTYLKLSNMRIGLLINFNVKMLYLRDPATGSIVPTASLCSLCFKIEALVKHG